MHKPQFDLNAPESAQWYQDVLSEEKVVGVGIPFKLVKKTDDPICARVSAGGTQDGQYLTYRGSLEDIKSILENCLKVVNAKLKKQES